MPINTYAQNFEDVMLWRALKHVPNGFYIDIGAQDPVFDSVSKGFYEQGWRGLHVEPTAQYSKMLRDDRPDETVLQAAVSNQSGMIQFFEAPDTGMSTAHDDIAMGVSGGGWKVNETKVAAVTLDQVFESIDQPDVHWLKIDVEGHEKEVLEGWRTSAIRPWIIVVEAIRPMTREPAHRAWHSLLVEKGYIFAYFDGVNRFYVSQDHKALKQHFAFGPCLWDEIQVPEINRTARTVVERYKRDYEKLRAETSDMLKLQGLAAFNAEQATAQIQSALISAVGALDAARAELAASTGVSDHQKAELEALRADGERLRQELADLRSRTDDPEARVAESERERAQAEAELAQQRADADQARIELKQVREAHHQSGVELDRLRAQLSLLGTERSRLADEIAPPLAELAAAQSEIEAHVDVAAGAQAASSAPVLAQTQAEVALRDEALSAALHERDVALQALERSAADFESLRQAHEQLGTQHEAVRADLEQANRDREGYRTALAESLREQGRLGVELGGMRTDIDSVKARLGLERDESRAVQAELAEARQMLAESFAEIAEARSQMDEAQTSLSRLRIEFDQLLAERDAGVVEASEARQRLEQLVSALAEAKIVASARGADLDLSRQELDQTSAELTEMHELFDLVCVELVAMREERDESRMQQIDVQRDFNATLLRLSESHSRHDRSQEKIAELQGQIEAGRAELARAEGLHAETMSRKAQVEQRLASILADLDYSHVVLANERAEAASLRQQLAGLLQQQQAAAGEMLARVRGRLSAGIEEATESLSWRMAATFSGAVRSLAQLPTEIAEACKGQWPEGSAASLKDLVAGDDAAFIEQAYRVMLGRGVDEQGARGYLDRMRKGASRMDVVISLRASAEGRKHDPKINGLDDVIRSYRRRYSPVLGPVVRTARMLRGVGRQRMNHLPTALADLLTFNDDAFVRRAYLSVLGREADAAGLRDQLNSLRNGATRVEIVQQLRRSAEGKRGVPLVPGLDQALRRRRRRRLPLVGSALRWVERSSPRITIERTPAASPALKPQLQPRAAWTPPASPSAYSPPAPTPSPALRPHADGVVAVRIAGTFERVASPGLAEAEIARALSERVPQRPDGAYPVNGTPLVLAKPISDILLESAAVKADEPTLLAGHDWGETGYPSEWVDVYNHRFAGVGCTTRHDRKVLIDRGAELPLAVIGVGVDHWERIRGSGEQRVRGKRFRFLHVSPCDAASGVDALLRAFGRVFGRDDNVTLIIKPTGAEPSDVASLLAKLRAENASFPDVIIIDRQLDEAQLKALYTHCHVFLALSRADGFSLPVAKAFLSGIPVVTTAWGGQLDYCDAENAWLVDYSFQYARTERNLVASIWVEPNAAALDDALWSAYSSTPAERAQKAQAGRDKLINGFTWSAVSTRLSEFAHEVNVGAANGRRNMRIGWLTTWNVKCGIATYSAHLLSGIPQQDQVVLAARQGPPLEPDAENCLRCWTPGKDHNGLDGALAALDSHAIDIVMIQFNYGFYNHRELQNFIEAAVARGKIVVVDLHSTLEPPGTPDNFRLSDLLNGLKKCHRILAHGPADMNRLKAMGLVDNVKLFPHGVMNKPGDPIIVKRQDAAPMIASFGFCFANKGLVELVQAVAILKARGIHVRLRMVNAEFPAPESADIVCQLRSEVKRLGLEQGVELHTEFLDDATCLSLLSEAELVVNPYQNTGESASGSVRYGLAIGRPVAVTPLSIFDDLGEAVFRMPGTSPEDIARGIAQALDHIASRTETASRVAEFARRWREEHDFSRQGARLMQIARALAR